MRDVVEQVSAPGTGKAPLIEVINRYSEMDIPRFAIEAAGLGTWIIDEASFYDERLAYVVSRESEEKGLTFIFPTLILNFRREIFNATARLILDTSTDVFPLTAYCEHPDCLADAFYTYRYYQVDGQECPALFFDPLIVIDSDGAKWAGARSLKPQEPWKDAGLWEGASHLTGRTFLFVLAAGEAPLI